MSFLSLCYLEKLPEIKDYLEHSRHEINQDILNQGFIIASQTNNIALVSYLIEQGANDFATAFQQCCLHDSTDDVMALFIHHYGVHIYNNVAAMKRAIFSNDPHVIHTLIQAGYNDKPPSFIETFLFSISSSLNIIPHQMNLKYYIKNLPLKPPNCFFIPFDNHFPLNIGSCPVLHVLSLLRHIHHPMDIPIHAAP
jgi:hypothetical protein